MTEREDILRAMADHMADDLTPEPRLDASAYRNKFRGALVGGGIGGAGLRVQDYERYPTW